jgi:hypothetical protein
MNESQSNSTPTPEEKQLSRLRELYADVRDELKQRIQQRDKYAFQVTIAIGAIMGFGLKEGQHRVLIAAPLVSLYFTVLILYSYLIHSNLTRYLREHIEPEIARLCGHRKEIEFESWCSENRTSSIRRWFFLGAMWSTVVLCMCYAWWGDANNPSFWPILGVATLFYGFVAALVHGMLGCAKPPAWCSGILETFSSSTR